MEIWEDIPGYVGRYQASSEGRIRGLHRFLPRVIDEGVRREKRVLKPGNNRKGREQVMLCRPIYGQAKVEVKRHQVHRLVYEAFNGPTDLFVLHRDGDCTNNRIDNLYAGTQKQNMHDKKGHGTDLFGELSPVAVLTAKDVVAIRNSDEKQFDLAKRYGVTQVTISHIKSFKTWKHLIPYVLDLK